MKFLFSWLLLSDAVNTIIVQAVLFAKTQLGASVLMLAALAVLVPFSAIFGACKLLLVYMNFGLRFKNGLDFFLYIQRRFNLGTKAMIIVVVSCQTLLPLYGVLGLFAPFGLIHQWELWPVAIYHGLLLGAMQSFSRVFYAEMLPKSREAEFFSLYAITDKGASWIGPLIVGAITDRTHEPRYSFFFLFACLVLSLVILLTVNPRKGREDAVEFAKLEAERNR
jgi:UMF1 family MFS transporter